MSAEKDREPVSEVSSHATMPAGAVFLSYASEDAAAAERVATALRNAGVEVWFDKSELRGGDAWDRMIHEQIQACALFMPIISANAHARVEGYFRLEWKLAVDRSHRMAPDQAFLVPVAIDDTRQNDTRIPDRFRELQWTRLPGGVTPPAFVERVRELLSPEAPAARPGPARQELAPAMAPTPGRSELSLWGWRPAFWAIGAMAVVALAYVVIDKFWVSKPTTAATTSAAAPSITAPEKSIAVLPFADLSEKHDQEYLADGMAEEILGLLAKLPELKVIGRTSSFSFKGKQTDLSSIGKILGVAYLVEGSIRRIDDHIRVAAQLVDARNGSHRWSETYDGSTTDVLRLQDEIALRVARALDLQLGGGEALPSRVSINSPEAYEYYLRGLRELAENSNESIDAAHEYFQKSLALAPKFGPAAVGIAEADLFKCVDAIQPEVTCPRAHEAVEAALKLDPGIPDAYATRAELLTVFDWNWAAAEADVRRAIELGGGQLTKYAAARVAYATGRWDRGRELLNGIIATDPIDPNAMTDLANFVEWKTGHFEEAESWMRKALQIAPNWAGGNYELGLTQLMQGKLDEALMSMKREKVDYGQLPGLAVVYLAMGRKANSDAALNAMERNGSYFPSDFARVHAFRGDIDRAMKDLEKAYETHDPDLWYIKDDPQLKNLENDPRYKAFLRKMRLPE